MRKEEIRIYKFDELSEESKENARAWWKSCEDEDNTFHEFIYEDMANIAELFGLDIKQRQVKLMDGSTRLDPDILFSGFWSQGDGACFQGHYTYKKGAFKAVKSYAPEDTEIHSIVKALQETQRKNFYSLSVNCKHVGHYYHSGSMRIEVDRNDGQEPIGSDEIDTQLRLFADLIYDRLEQEYEYIMSDKNIDESIRINEYEFTEDGKIY